MIRGYFKGLIREVSGIIGVVVGFYGANTYYQLLVLNYQNLNDLEKAQLAQQFMAQNQPAQPTQQYSNYDYNTGNSGSMDWNTYNTLSNMSLQNHASMMNSIEAIGGSGDYWYVK